MSDQLDIFQDQPFSVLQPNLMTAVGGMCVPPRRMLLPHQQSPDGLRWDPKTQVPGKNSALPLLQETGFLVLPTLALLPVKTPPRYPHPVLILPSEPPPVTKQVFPCAPPTPRGSDPTTSDRAPTGTTQPTDQSG